MHGIILKKMGFRVHVLERSASDILNSEAAGIRAGPEIHDFIQQHVPSPLDYSVTAQMVEIMDGEGNIIQKLPPQHPLRLTTWKIVYDMLKNALLQSIDGQQVAIYKTRQLVQNVEQSQEKIRVTVMDLETGTSMAIEGDLVVAADGAHSAIRKKLCPEVNPQYAGYVTWRGRVPEEAVSSRTREVLRDRCVILRVEGGYQISCVNSNFIRVRTRTESLQILCSSRWRCQFPKPRLRLDLVRYPVTAFSTAWRDSDRRQRGSAPNYSSQRKD
jgi:2-polyprenyl-6-methoxyphenol hydroxylase-like FAD-dependent oxidoreductase